MGSLIHATMVIGSPGWGKAVFVANVAAAVFLPVLVTEINAYRCRNKESTFLIVQGLLAKIRAYRRRKKEQAPHGPQA